MESIWLLIVLLIFLVFILPLFVKYYVSYSPIQNSGMIVIKIGFIYISYFSFQLKANSVVIRSKKKRKQIEYKFNDPMIIFYEHFFNEIKQKVKIKKINIYSEIGTGDAFHSAILSSFVNIIYKIISAYVKNLKYSSSIMVNTNTSFNKKVLITSFYVKASMSLFDIFFCFFTSLFYEGKNKHVK
ncbi:MAG: hypothetical protein PHX09_00080 [Clostridia bacterium]|nr:hypothetical protein [Clostridia bacterium]